MTMIKFIQKKRNELVSKFKSLKIMIFNRNKQEKYNKERFYGAYIHDLRRYYEIPQKDLAKALHVSKSTWSKMESGQQNMDYSMFHHCNDYFQKIDSDYNFNENVSKLSEAEQWIEFCLKEWINLSYFDNLDKIKAYLDQEENKHSSAYFLYKIVEAFYNLFNEKGSMKELKSLIETQYFQDNYSLAILYDLCGIIEDSSKPEIIENQIEILRKALAYAQRANHTGLTGLIEYHLIYRYDDLNQPIHALDLIDSCKNHLQKAGAYRRILTVQMNEGILYRKVGFYTKSTEIYQNLQNNLSQIKDSKIQKSIYDNFSWCLFMQEKDEQALEYAKQALSLGSTFPDIYIVLAFSNYRLYQFDLARQYAIEFLGKNFEEERAVLIGLFMKLVLAVLDQEPDIASLASQITSLLPDFRAVELEIPFYSLLTDYYKSQNDFSRALDAQDKLVSYLKFNFNFH